MSFLGGDTKKIKFVLTNTGYKTMAEKGLENQIYYYSFFDQEVNYLINTKPQLMVDINGSNDSIVPNSVKFKNPIH